jgi:hypothetical protein
MRNAHKILVENPEGNRSLVNHSRIWDDNIKIYIEEIGRQAVY